ncbi:hypothetical protein FQN57_003011 [Myotisia sp. PD_48]|nr:hypothetical protein FQN57_003011 [Myotisia sp. PD_48]
MSSNRPFLANFLAAFRAQSSYKAVTSKPPSPSPSPSHLSPSSTYAPSTPITSSARTIATKAGGTSTTAANSPQSITPGATTSGLAAVAASSSSSSHHHPHRHHHHHQRSNHHHHHHHTTTQSHSSTHSNTTLSPTRNAVAGINQQSIPAPTASTAIPIPTSTTAASSYSSSASPFSSHRRNRRGSDSSSGSGGFHDALGQEKWYIGGRTPGGEERMYPLGMVTKIGGRIGGDARVGSVDQLSL